MQVKGLEMGMHEPRLKQGLAVGFAVANHGGDHEIGFDEGRDPGSGVPTQETLEALGLGWTAEELADRGLAKGALES